MTIALKQDIQRKVGIIQYSEREAVASTRK